MNLTNRLQRRCYVGFRNLKLFMALAEVDGTQNRDKFIKQALLVEHEEMAFIYQRMAEMMLRYHKNV